METVVVNGIEYEVFAQGTPNALISAVSKIYFIFYEVDLSTDTFVKYHATRFVSSVTDQFQSASECLQAISRKVFVPEHHQMVSDFYDSSTWTTRLEHDETVYLDSRGIESGWVRTNLIVARRDENGVPLRVIIAAQGIQKAKERELAQERRLEEQKIDLERALSEQQTQTAEIVALNEKLEQRSRELELSQQRAILRLDTVAESIHGGFKTSKDDPSFTFTYVSEQLAAMAGYTVEEFLEESGGSMAGIVNLEDARREVPRARQQIDRGEMYTMNYRLRRKDGSWMNVEDRGRLISMPGEEGEYWSFLVDKDELIEKTEALQAAERQLEIIHSLSATFNALYYVDMRNYSFVELGTTLEGVTDIIGEKGDAAEGFEMFLEHIVSPEYVEDMRRFCDLSTINERMRDRVWIGQQFHSPLNGWAEAAFIAAERDAEGNLVHVIWSTKDVNEQKSKELSYQVELEQARDAANAANDAKTTFLFSMSHDIRTPMNAIIGFTRLLEKHLDDPKRSRTYLRKIETASSVLLSIINNVLEMARIEKGSVELEETTWSGGDLTYSLQETFGTLMEEKDIAFTCGVNLQHRDVICDSVKLRQVFGNLLSNAYKYTEPGGTVSMFVDELPDPREGWVRYRTVVSDTGIGMSEEFLPRLFEEFTRENSTTDTKVEGTGLGMPIVKRLVKLMDGTIEVQSKKGQGTTFTVVIPHRVFIDSKALQNADYNVDAGLFEGKRVLLAEDNDLNAEIAIEILTGSGFVVERAEDGLVCVEKMQAAASGYYDVVLMDVQMPRMNGYDATRAIRVMDDLAKARTPILAMTANAFVEDRREAIRAGMNGHLAKPVSVSDLLRTLARVLR